MEPKKLVVETKTYPLVEVRDLSVSGTR